MQVYLCKVLLKPNRVCDAVILKPTWPNILVRLFTIEKNSAIANSLKPIGMMKMQCVTVYPNIYEYL